MATPQENAAMWLKRFSAWDQRYADWEKRFRCDSLEDFFEGHQWKEDEDKIPELKRYVINLFFSSIEAKIPTVTITRPIFNLTPRPSKQDFDQNYAALKSQLQQDTLNTFVMDRKNRFSELIEQFAYDVFFRFAVAETGYSAEWIDNPKAGQPIMEEAIPNDDPEHPKVLKWPAKLAENEQIFVNRINPRAFRCGGRISRYIERCTYVGYFEYIPTKMLKADESLENREFIGTSHRTTAYGNADFDREAGDAYIEDTTVTKVYKIWATNEKQFYLIDGESGYVLKTFKYERLPLKFFGPIPRTRVESLYPVPYAYNWMSPQIEINEVREAVRAHRRRFARKYVIEKGLFADSAEFSKLLNGPDGTFAESDGIPNGRIEPLPANPMDQASAEAAVTSKDDFNVISATSSEQRLQSDRTTATQATLINNRATQRENRNRVIFTRFLCDIASDVLWMHRKLVNPVWVKRFVDSPNTIGVEFPQLVYTWQQILAEELEGEDFDLTIDITALSDDANEVEKRKFFELLAVLNQYPALSFSPVLITEAMNRIGYTNTAVRQALLQMAMMQAIGATQMMQNQSQMGQQQMAKSTPDTMEQIRQQLTNQVAGGTS